jgi:hypothetical protein
MHHQPLAHKPRRIGQAVRLTGSARHQQKAGGPDAVGAEDDDLGALPPFAPVGVDVDKSGDEAGGICFDLLDARLSDEPGAGLLRQWPVRSIRC